MVGVQPDGRDPRAIAREFRAHLAGGARLEPAGRARSDPSSLLRPRYLPRHAVALFDALYYLTDFRYDDTLNFFVGYVGLRERGGEVRRLHPRIFYKDSSLLWRVATHLIDTEERYWIGKGDVRRIRIDGEEHLASDEDGTNLPYEIQPALDAISRRTRARRDDDGVALVLRRAPHDRIEPYADFSRPRRLAQTRAAIHRGRPIARIRRRGDPRSLEFARGFEPDFDAGVLEVSPSRSRLYGGRVQKFRVRSRNGQVQYQLVATPAHAWINPPQAFTTHLTTYGVRALHVLADEEIFVPGYEYHYLEHEMDPPRVYSQIPAGYAGAPSPSDPHRADASAWIEALPVIREFRARLLAPRRRRRP